MAAPAKAHGHATPTDEHASATHAASGLNRLARPRFRSSGIALSRPLSNDYGMARRKISVVTRPTGLQCLR
jgi:hypothetical protein